MIHGNLVTKYCIDAMALMAVFTNGCRCRPRVDSLAHDDLSKVIAVSNAQQICDGLFDYCSRQGFEQDFGQMCFTFHQDMPVSGARGWAEGWVDNFIDETLIDFERRIPTVHLLNELGEAFIVNRIHSSVAAVQFSGGQYDFSSLSACPNVKCVVADCRIAGRVEEFVNRFPNVEVLSLSSVSEPSMESKDISFLHSLENLEMLYYMGKVQMRNLDRMLLTLLGNEHLRRIVIQTSYERDASDANAEAFLNNCTTQVVDGAMIASTTNGIHVTFSHQSSCTDSIRISSTSNDIVVVPINEVLNTSQAYTQAHTIYLYCENVIPNGVALINNGADFSVRINITMLKALDLESAPTPNKSTVYSRHEKEGE